MGTDQIQFIYLFLSQNLTPPPPKQLNNFLNGHISIHGLRLSLSSRIVCSLDRNIHKYLEKIAINL